MQLCADIFFLCPQVDIQRFIIVAHLRPCLDGDVGDGNDIDEVSAAVKHAKLGIGSGKPTMVILNTKKGCGVKWIEDLGAGNHNTNLSAEQAEAAIRELRGEA